MICCEDGQNYTPHGREVLNSHPNRPTESQRSQEWWTVVEHNGREEELYVCNQTAVWSRGQPEANFRNSPDESSCDASRGRGRSVVCTFTVESKIKQALFTTFFTYPDQPAMLGEPVLDHPTGTPLYSLCILEQEYLNVYTETGEEFSIALPFAVEKMWSIWYGLLLQRKVSASELDNPHPLLFSLLHPLEEISPINQKIGSSNSVLPCYGADVQQSIILTSLYPSIAITHSAKHNSVSVWRTRRCNMEENAAMVHNCSFSGDAAGDESGAALNTTAKSGLPTPHLPHTAASPAPPLHFTPSRSFTLNHTSLNFTPSQHSQLNFTPLQFTPTQFTPGATLHFTPRALSPNPSPHCFSHFASPAGVTPVARHSPLYGCVKTPVNARLRSVLTAADRITPKQRKALFTRTPSPSCLSAQHARLGPSPSPRAPRSTLPSTPAPSAGRSILNDSLGEVDPLIPDLCLELLWTDQTAVKPRSAFLTEDCVGQRFLCLLVNNLLRVIKYEHTNDFTSLVFGSCVSIAVKDAVPLPPLRMILVIDPSDSLCLYSGSVQVCNINITQSSLPLNTTLFKDFSSLNISSQLVSSVETPLRRSSLLPCKRNVPLLDEKLTFSPVVSEKSTNERLFDAESTDRTTSTSTVVSIRDPALQRVTIEHSSGVMNRITLPDLWSSSLVCRVLTAFKYILPRDTVLLFIARWYSTRNSPGSEDFSAQGEWSLFSRTLLGMVGYDTDKLQASWPQEPTGSHSPAAVQKKVKTTENGSEKDWEYLLSSQYHRQTSASMSEVLNLSWVGSIADDACSLDNNGLNVTAPLFSHMPAIFFALHLLYEELKCCMLYWELCSLLLPCLCQLGADLRATSYLYHYWRDFPTICCPEGPTLHLSEKNLSLITMPYYFTDVPPSFLSHVSKIMKGEQVETFPYIPEVCPLIRGVLLIYCVSAYDCSLSNITLEKYLKKISPANRKAFDPVRCLSISCTKEAPSMHEKIVLLTDHLGLTNLDVQLLSPGLSLLLINSQHQCRSNPPLGWYGSTYRLINRPDMVLHDQQAAEYNDLMIKSSQDAYSAPAQFDGFKSPQSNDTGMDPKEVEESYKVDGMDTLDWAVLRLRWPADKRVKDVRHMLNSATPVKIDIKQRLEVSDHEFQEEQERYLFCLCVRTMALPVGRGMFTLSTHTPIITETLPIPPLCLGGKAAPRGATVDLANVEVPPNMNMWPLFHNGVAAALKVHPSSEGINTSWILFNRPKTGTDLIIEHAGFLLGLGLCGHVSDLSTVGLHEYLSRAHELTSVGLLLGVAAARRGSCHAATTKLLSIHLECLLPPTCTELDIHHTVQVASIMGIGILYQGSGHRHMAEVLMREIGRPPGPEMENSNDRESYSLAAGLGLGLVMFGKGAEPNQFADLDIAGQLYHYIEGGYQKPITGPTRDKYKSPSYQIKEGKRVNIDVTSPGATLALGMIYFASGNQAVAQWMQAPETNFLLEQIRPDFLLLRIVSWGLIMWHQVVPSIEWVQGNVPNLVLKRIAALEENHIEDPNVDYETMYQAFFNLIAGSCFVLGLKFAGTANDSAFQVLYKYTTLLIRYAKNSTIAIISGKSTMESCLCCCLLSLSLVMAGTGDLEVLRLIRHLRDRVGPLNASVGYGSHMAVHMSLGFLFLGGGRFSISSDNFSIAALLISCFPKLPQHSLDNRYHLQAFRHLYVLACEPRLLVPVDIDSGRLCRAHVTLTMSGCREHPPLSYDEMAPVMLPPLSKLEEISIETDPTNGRFWPLRFTRESNTWNIVEALVRGGYGVALKLREGEAPYPPGQGTSTSEERARVGDMALLRPDKCSLLREQPLPWVAQRRELSGIEGERARQLLRVLLGCRDIDEEPSFPVSAEPLKAEPTSWPCEEALHQLLTTVVFDHLALGKPEAIASWITIIQGMKKIAQLSQNCGLLVWQVKLIQSTANFLVALNHRDSRTSTNFKATDRASVSEIPPSSSSSFTWGPRVLTLPTVAVSAATSADVSLHTSHHAFVGATAADVSISGATLSAALEALPASPVSSVDASFSAACGAPMDVTTDEFLPPLPVDQPPARSQDTDQSAPRHLVTPDQAISLRCRLEELFDSWASDVAPQLLQYLQQQQPQQQHRQQPQQQPGYSAKTALTFLLYDVPPPAVLASVMEKPTSKLSMARSLHRLGVSPAIIQSVLASS